MQASLPADIVVYEGLDALRGIIQSKQIESSAAAELESGPGDFGGGDDNACVICLDSMQVCARVRGVPSLSPVHAQGVAGNVGCGPRLVITRLEGLQSHA